MVTREVSPSWLPTALALVLGGAAASLLLVQRRRKKKQAAPCKPCVYSWLALPGREADTSPACLKLQTFFRMSGAEFDIIYFPQHKMKDSPKGKVPWIHWDAINDGNVLSDSTLIMNALVEKDPSTFDLDSHLTAEEKAIGTAFKTMLEESMYFQLMRARYDPAQSKRVTFPLYFASIPRIFRFPLSQLVQAKLLRDLKGQGLGLMEESEAMEKFRMELEAVAVYLGDKTYFMGDKITSFDATIYAYLACLVHGDWDHPVCKVGREEHSNLVSYVDRMRKEFWPEFSSLS